MATQQEVASLYARVTVNASQATSQLRDFRARLAQLTSSLKAMNDRAAMVGTLINTALAIPIGLLGKNAVGAVGDYEKAMNVFQLVTKASGEQMASVNAEIDKLGHERDIPYTKPEIAEAAAQLAFQLKDATAATLALRPALLLASAAETDAASGGALLGGVLQMFKLPAAEAGKVADELAGALKYGGLTFTQLKDAMENAGPSFAAAGVPLDVLATLIAQLGEQGIKGGEAGTILRNMLDSLKAPTEQASGALAALGVRVYDNENKMRPLGDIIGDLHTAFARLNPAQQNAYAQMLFGESSAGALTKIIQGGLPAFEQMHERVTEVGLAQEIATAKTKGLSGAAAEAGKEVQNAALSIVDPMKENLETIANGMAGLMRWFQALPDPVREAFGVLITIGALGPPVVFVLGQIAAGVGGVIEAAGFLVGAAGGAWVALAAALGPVGAVIVILGLLAAAVIWAYNNVGWFHDAVDRAFPGAAAAVGRFWDAVRPAFDWLTDKLKDIIDLWNRIKDINLGSLGITPGGLVGAALGPASGPLGAVIGAIAGLGGATGTTFNPDTGVTTAFPNRARGGGVTAGQSYMVGERGVPEIFTPDRNGYVSPTGGSGDLHLHLYGDVYGVDDLEAKLARALQNARQKGVPV